MTSLVQSGEAYAGGPLLEQSDPSLRGLMIFAVPLDEAQGLARGREHQAYRRAPRQPGALDRYPAIRWRT